MRRDRLNADVVVVLVGADEMTNISADRRRRPLRRVMVLLLYNVVVVAVAPSMLLLQECFLCPVFGDLLFAVFYEQVCRLFQDHAFENNSLYGCYERRMTTEKTEINDTDHDWFRDAVVKSDTPSQIIVPDHENTIDSEIENADLIGEPHMKKKICG